MKTTMPSELQNQFCSAEKLKATFEDFIKSSEKFKDNTPLGTMEINGQFHHYMEPDTDTMWIGFAMGYRCAILEHLETLTKPNHPTHDGTYAKTRQTIRAPAREDNGGMGGENFTMRYYFVESFAAWFIHKCRTKREARSEGVKEFGRGMVRGIRLATKGELKYYQTLKGKL